MQVLPSPELVPSSMQGSNSISQDFGMKGPGSLSESTAGVPAGDPRVEIPPVASYTHTQASRGPGTGSDPWSRADGSAWVTSSDVSSSGDAPGGPWRQV
jgi:hypothetical protein